MRGPKTRDQRGLREERAQRLFDHLIDQQLMIFPKIDNADLEGVCKWHMTELHTTDKCQTFRAFVARLVQKGKLSLLPIDGEALDLGSKEKLLEAMKGKSIKAEGNNDSKTYKDVLEADPSPSRLIQSMKNLRRNMCFGCADMLHFELVRSQAIPNDPKWVPAYQRRSMKRARELEVGGPSKGSRGMQVLGTVRKPLGELKNQINVPMPKMPTKTQKKKQAKAMAANARAKVGMQLMQEAMVADIKVQEQKEEKKKEKEIEDNADTFDKPSNQVMSDLDACVDAIDKLSDQVMNAEKEDGELEDFSDSELDLLVTDEDLPPIQFGSIDSSNLECMMVTMLPKEFSAKISESIMPDPSAKDRSV